LEWAIIKYLKKRSFIKKVKEEFYSLCRKNPPQDVSAIFNLISKTARVIYLHG